jgi:hypothetical protein
MGQQKIAMQEIAARLIKTTFVATFYEFPQFFTLLSRPG